MWLLFKDAIYDPYIADCLAKFQPKIYTSMILDSATILK
ncbi:MAG: hypothetical protein ACI85Q_001752 [Salibacteraceae bacterium]|jgi:hypothetical protein